MRVWHKIGNKKMLAPNAINEMLIPYNEYVLGSGKCKLTSNLKLMRADLS